MIAGSILLAACSDPPDQADAMHAFDHVMVGVRDLDSGISILEESTGVSAAYGGIHPGRDTRNALLSLGSDRYFELIAPQAGLEEMTDPIALATVELRTPTPMHWAVATRNIEVTRRTVMAQGWQTTEVTARSRETPDGTQLRWRMFFITDDADAAAIPFFIEWGEDSVHPSQTSPAGCELAKFIVHTPDRDRIFRLVQSLGLEIDVQDSTQDRLELSLICGESEISLP